MINHQNISYLFDFLKNNKNLRNIGLNITSKGLKKVKNNHKSDIVIKKNSIICSFDSFFSHIQAYIVKISIIS